VEVNSKPKIGKLIFYPIILLSLVITSPVPAQEEEAKSEAEIKAIIGQIRQHRAKREKKAAQRVNKERSARSISQQVRSQRAKTAKIQEEKKKQLALLYGKDFVPVKSIQALEKNQYNFIDWSGAIRKGLIKPVDLFTWKKKRNGAVQLEFNQEGKDKPHNTLVLLNSKRKTKMMPVIFPHKSHEVWHSCDNCHPNIFSKKPNREKISSMRKIKNGEFCGRCHGKVAFPVKQCKLCHIDKKSYLGAKRAGEQIKAAKIRK